MPLTLEQLSALGTASLIIALLLWWLSGTSKEKFDWIAKYGALIASIAEMEANRNAAREKNSTAMLELATAIRQLAVSIDRLTLKQEIVERDTNALFERVRALLERMDRKVR